ncbi:MAG: thermonuclease family protein [Micropepsaceae bacterium]
MRGHSAVVCMFALAIPADAAAESFECALAVAEQVIVSTVTDGAQLTLVDGRHVRLAAVLTPMRSFGRSNVEDQPLAEEARARLSALVLNRKVGLAFDERGTDRHGDVLAYVRLDDRQAWLQALLVSDGFARVHAPADSRKCASALLALEDRARQAKRGLWARPFYRVRRPGDLDGDIGTFQIVEGTIVDVVERRDRIYLNFGTDYRTDFTVTIAPRIAKRLRKDGVDPLTWKARTVRVRGWISLLNGPEIELAHREQVEFLK